MPPVDLYRASCGRDRPCPGELGVVIATTWPAPVPAGYPWCVYGATIASIENANGFRRDADGRYVVLKPRLAANGRPIGRRRLPDDFLVQLMAGAKAGDSGGDRSPHPGGRGIVGQGGLLPMVVVCPVCGSPNRVGPPAPG